MWCSCIARTLAECLQFSGVFCFLSLHFFFLPKFLFKFQSGVGFNDSSLPTIPRAHPRALPEPRHPFNASPTSPLWSPSERSLERRVSWSVSLSSLPAFICFVAYLVVSAPSFSDSSFRIEVSLPPRCTSVDAGFVCGRASNAYPFSSAVLLAQPLKNCWASRHSP